MRARDTNAIPLAPRPDLAQYRRLAKELTAACRSGDMNAIRSWAGAWIERLANLRIESATPEYVRSGDPRQLDRSVIAREVDDIVNAAGLHLLDAGASARALSSAQVFLARLHGFQSWPRFVEHIESAGRMDSAVGGFEAAADAIVTGDIDRLRTLVRVRPELVHARSSREHQATLLHYVAANGHEGFRQRTPPNAVAIARFLLESGAHADALATMYDRRCTTMEMLVSSTHPHAAGVQSALVETLLDFGAAVDGVEDNGSPLMTALRFRYPRAAETLARRGARVDNVIAAAALGRMELVNEFLTSDGRLRAGVPLARVPWPSLPADPAVHVAHALTWASSFGHATVVRIFLQRGVDPSARDEDATALHYAAAYGHADVMHLLLDHGASLEARNRFGGTVLAGTLWYAFNDPQPGVDYANVVRVLLDAGARTDVYRGMRDHVDAVLAGRPGGEDPHR